MRPRYTPAVPEMKLYVPADGALTFIKKGSAVVGVATDEGGHIRCYYEGSIYNQDMSFEEKLASACGRLSERYPTSALCYAKPDQLIEVAIVRYDQILGAWVISEFCDEATLEAWTGSTHVAGGSRDQHERAAGLIIHDGGTSAMIAWQTAVRSKADPVNAVIAHARAKS